MIQIKVPTDLVRDEDQEVFDRRQVSFITVNQTPDTADATTASPSLNDSVHSPPQRQGLIGSIALAIRAAPLAINLGGVPTSVSPDAEALLSGLPRAPLSRILAALREWAQSVPLSAARIRRVSDPESADWNEVVIEMRTKVDAKSASEMWDDLASNLERVMRDLPPEQRQLFDRHLGVHLLWGDDRWNDDDAVSV